MGSLGAGNPLSFELGGGPSRVEQINSALKASVGVGGSAIDGTMEAEWRLAKARGWTASLDDERAMYQTWPDTVDEGGVEVFEELLGITPPRGATLEDRRQTASTLWVKVSSAATPDLLTELQLIDPDITILNLSDRTSGTTTVSGRAFQDAVLGQPESNGPQFTQLGVIKDTQFANFSHDFVAFVSFPNPPGPLGKVALDKLLAIVDLLNLSLPSWCSFQISTQLDPAGCFTLDLDPLDLTPLCEDP